MHAACIEAAVGVQEFRGVEGFHLGLRSRGLRELRIHGFRLRGIQ